MAKDDPELASGQQKVSLRPTEIGLLVMRRLARPHTDKSAVLRHLIELGYACERAGFILDGTVLRHGGRVWDVQPDLGNGVAGSSSVAAEAGAAVTGSSDDGGTGASAVPVVEERPAPALAPAVRKAASKDDTKGASPLRANLRNLSR